MSKLNTLLSKRLLPLGVAASIAAVLLVPASANATPYVVKIVQQGNDVIVTGSGTFDLTGLTYLGTYAPVTNTLQPSIGYIEIGPPLIKLDGFTGILGPTNFGSGSSGFVATAATGDLVGMMGSTSTFWVPYRYVSENALFGTSTYDNANFASLGVTPGTYAWTWGNGADQSFTLEIGNAVDAPEPAALGMFGFGVLLISALVGLRRRTA